MSLYSPFVYLNQCNESFIRAFDYMEDGIYRHSVTHSVAKELNQKMDNIYQN